MGEENVEAFLFLTNDEFGRLSTSEKGNYIRLAARELDQRQRHLRDQTIKLIEEQQKAKPL